MKASSTAVLFAASLVATLAAPVGAQAKSNFSADYTVTLRGITIGRISLAGDVEADRYKVGGTLASAGLARIFARTDATAETSGRLGKDAARPDRFLLDYTQGGTHWRTEIGFQKERAVKTSITPEPPERTDDIIRIAKSDLERVVDPLSATVLARGTPQDICSRTLRVYEGGTRVDVKLSLAGTGFVYGAGKSAVSCRGDFIPVAGMTRGEKTYEYLRKNADMQFVYVPAGNGVYLLHSLSAQTDIGRVELSAWRKKIE